MARNRPDPRPPMRREQEKEAAILERCWPLPRAFGTKWRGRCARIRKRRIVGEAEWEVSARATKHRFNLGAASLDQEAAEG